jgi:hypothetical protein
MDFNRSRLSTLVLCDEGLDLIDEAFHSASGQKGGLLVGDGRNADKVTHP